MKTTEKTIDLIRDPHIKVNIELSAAQIATLLDLVTEARDKEIAKGNPEPGKAVDLAEIAVNLIVNGPRQLMTVMGNPVYNDLPLFIRSEGCGYYSVHISALWSEDGQAHRVSDWLQRPTYGRPGWSRYYGQCCHVINALMNEAKDPYYTQPEALPAAREAVRRWKAANPGRCIAPLYSRP